MKKPPSEAELTSAKRVREKRLARFKAIYEACVCMFPLVVYRNRSMHDDGCPAHALSLKFHEEDKQAKLELGR